AQGNTHILDGVMEIDMQVPLAGYIHVDERVPRQLVEHLIEKADAGRHIVHAGAIEIHRYLDLGLVGRAGETGSPHGSLRELGGSLSDRLGRVKIGFRPGVVKPTGPPRPDRIAFAAVTPKYEPTYPEYPPQ